VVVRLAVDYIIVGRSNSVRFVVIYHDERLPRCGRRSDQSTSSIPLTTYVHELHRQLKVQREKALRRKTTRLFLMYKIYSSRTIRFYVHLTHADG
jgi:hypothetical protein